jgi:alpha/beta superfamily hydrolase
LLAGQGLPALDNDVNVLRVEFQTVADALGEFGGGEGRPTAEEGVVDQLAAVQMISRWAGA